MNILILHGRIPSKKNSYRVSKDGGLYKPKNITSFEHYFGKEVAGHHMGYVVGGFALKVRLRVHGHDQDLDNAVTTILDCLQMHGVVLNDKNCMQIDAQKSHSSAAEAGATITVTPL